MSTPIYRGTPIYRDGSIYRGTPIYKLLSTHIGVSHYGDIPIYPLVQKGMTLSFLPGGLTAPWTTRSADGTGGRTGGNLIFCGSCLVLGFVCVRGNTGLVMWSLDLLTKIQIKTPGGAIWHWVGLLGYPRIPDIV